MRSFIATWIATLVLGTVILWIGAGLFGENALWILLVTAIAVLVCCISGLYGEVDGLRKRIAELERQAGMEPPEDKPGAE